MLMHVALCRVLASNGSGFGPGVPLGMHEVLVIIALELLVLLGNFLTG